MQLYNSLSRSIDGLRLDRDPVLIYACGITPYDTTHLGHAFTYASLDLLVRYLEHRGHAVRYVQNVTDIDDDILRTARKAGEDWKALGDRWTVHFIEDMVALNVRPPDVFPRATDVIPEIVQAVERLLAVGKAYLAGGSAYYDLTTWPSFGRLSGLSRDEMLPVANERGNKPDDPNKRDPLDFVLWQAQAPGEPAWDSPWGPGRPGWHIECSTMAGKFLGDTLDVHAGGGDLIFPHHESEIAQAEPLTGSEFVRSWMHVAMVRHEGEKMSKSLGNLVMVRDVLRRGTADGLRLYLDGHHYRSPWSFDETELQAAQARADRWQAAAGGLDGGEAGGGKDGGGVGRLGVGTAGYGGRSAEVVSTPEQGPRRQGAPVIEGGELLLAARRAFDQAMDDDLDTPTALRTLDALAEGILSAKAGDLRAAQEELRTLAGVLGLRLGRGPEPSVAAGWGEHLLRFAAQSESG